MPRLFLAIDLPDPIDFELEMLRGGIHGARWQTREQLHLTLHFIGEVDGGEARRLRAALGALESPAFDLELFGSGVFPPRGQANTLWIGVRESDPLRLLHQRTAAILDAQRLPRERRKYTPHVTVARLKRAPAPEVGAWVAAHSLFASPSFPVRSVQLYSSVLTSAGAKYRVDAEFPLGEL